MENSSLNSKNVNSRQNTVKCLEKVLDDPYFSFSFKSLFKMSLIFVITILSISCKEQTFYYLKNLFLSNQYHYKL